MINIDEIKNLPANEEVLSLILNLKHLLVKLKLYEEAAKVRDIERKIIAGMEFEKEKMNAFEFATFLTLFYHTSHHVVNEKPEISYYENGTNNLHSSDEVYENFKKHQKKTQSMPIENSFGMWEPMPDINTIDLSIECLKKHVLSHSTLNKDEQISAQETTGTE